MVPGPSFLKILLYKYRSINNLVVLIGKEYTPSLLGPLLSSLKEKNSKDIKQRKCKSFP